jgi:hypothetical protein
MVDLGALADLRLLDFAEIADLGFPGEMRAGPEAGEGSDFRALADGRALQMREGADARAGMDLDTGAEDDIRFDRYVGAIRVS